MATATVSRVYFSFIFGVRWLLPDPNVRAKWRTLGSRVYASLFFFYFAYSPLREWQPCSTELSPLPQPSPSICVVGAQVLQVEQQQLQQQQRQGQDGLTRGHIQHSFATTWQSRLRSPKNLDAPTSLKRVKHKLDAEVSYLGVVAIVLQRSFMFLKKRVHNGTHVCPHVESG